MRGEAFEDVLEVLEGIDPAAFAGGHEAVKHGGAPAAGVGTGEEPVLAVMRSSP